MINKREKGVIALVSVLTQVKQNKIKTKKKKAKDTQRADTGKKNSQPN